MGTYTTNYNLFMPSIGEQGWGDLVNGNFSTIDSTMKGLDTRTTVLDTRTTALESADIAFDARLQPLEAGEFETVNCTGYITADGFSGRLYVASEYTTEEGDAVFSTASAQSANATNGATTKLTVADFVKSNEFPMKISPGVYIPSEDLIEGDYETIKSNFTRTVNCTFNAKTGSGTGYIYVDDAVVRTQPLNGNSFTFTYYLYAGQTIYMTMSSPRETTYLTVSIPESKIYITTK